ncbi:MAG: hypothetical protein AB7V42_12870 [Thermoleophilia bacterium]
MPDLDVVLRDARPRWPEPPAALERRILDGLGLIDDAAPAARRSPTRWLARASRSRRTRLIAIAALAVASGTALAVGIMGGRAPQAPGAQPAAMRFGEQQVVASFRGHIDGPVSATVDDAGRVYLVWSRADAIYAAVRQPRGAWGAPERLSPPAQASTAPKVIAGADGHAIVVWRRRDPGREVARELTLPGGDPAGTLTIRTGATLQVVARARTSAGTWGPLEEVAPPVPADVDSDRPLPDAPPQDAAAPQLGMVEDGQAIVAFGGDDGPRVVRRSPDGTWSPPESIAAGSGPATDVSLSVERFSGWAAIAWTRRAPGAAPDVGRAYASVRPPGGTWGPSADLGERPDTFHDNELDGAPAAFINGLGSAVVVWGNAPVLASTRQRDGAWTTPAVLVPEGGQPASLSGAPPTVAVDGDGRGLVITSIGRRLVAFRQGADGAWSDGIDWGATAFESRVAADARNALVVAVPRTGYAEVGAPAPDGRFGGERVAEDADLPVLATGRNGATVIAGDDAAPARTRIVAVVADGGGS